MSIKANPRFIRPSEVGSIFGGNEFYILERELQDRRLLPKPSDNIAIKIGNEVHGFVSSMVNDPEKRGALPKVFQGYTESEREFSGVEIPTGTAKYQTGGTIDLMDFGGGVIADIKTGYGKGALYQLETYALLAEASNKNVSSIRVIRPLDVQGFKRAWQQAETDEERIEALGMMADVEYEWNNARRKEALENVVRAYERKAQIKGMVEKVPRGARLELPDPNEDWHTYKKALQASLRYGRLPVTTSSSGSDKISVRMPTQKQAEEIDKLGFDPNESFYRGQSASRAGAKVIHKYTKYGHTPLQVIGMAESVIGNKKLTDVTAGEIDRMLNSKFQSLYGETPSQVSVGTSRYMQPAQRQRLLTGIIDESIEDISQFPEGRFRRQGGRTLISSRSLLAESLSIRTPEGVPLTPHDFSTPKGKVKIDKDIQRHGSYQYVDVIVNKRNILRRAGSPQGPLDRGGIKVSGESPGVMKGINLNTLVLMENWLPQGQAQIQKGLVDYVSQTVTKEVDLPANFDLDPDSIRLNHVWGESENIVPFAGSAPIDIDALGTKGEDGREYKAMPVDAGTRSAWKKVKLLGYDIVEGEKGRKKLSLTFHRRRGIEDNVALKTFFQKHTLSEANLSQIIPGAQGTELLTYLKRPNLLPSSYWFAQDESKWRAALGSKFTGDKELTWANYSSDLTDHFFKEVLPDALTVQTLRYSKVHKDQLRFLQEQGGDRVVATPIGDDLFDVKIKDVPALRFDKLFHATRLENIVRKPRLGVGDLAKLRDRSPKVYKNLMARTEYGREWRQGLMNTAIASYGANVPDKEGYTRLTRDLASKIMAGTAEFGVPEENIERAQLSRAVMLSAKKVLEDEGLDPTKPFRVGSKYVAAPEYALLLGAADVEGYDVAPHGRAYAEVFESIVGGQSGEHKAAKYADVLGETVGGKDFIKKAFSAIDPGNMYGNVGQASRRLAANEIVLPESFVLKKYLGREPKNEQRRAEYQKAKSEFLKNWKKGKLTVPALAWGQPTTGTGEEFGSYIKVLHPDVLKDEELPSFSSRFVLSEQLAEAMGRDFDADLFWSMLIGTYEGGKVKTPGKISLAKSQDILRRAREQEAAGRPSLLAGELLSTPTGMESEWNALVNKYNKVSTDEKPSVAMEMLQMQREALRPLTEEQVTQSGRYAEGVLKGRRLGASYNFIERMQKLIGIKFGGGRDLKDAAGHFMNIVHGRRQTPKRLDEPLATAMQIATTVSPTSGGYIKTPEAYLKAMQGSDPKSEIWANTWKGMGSYPVIVKNLLSSEVSHDVREGVTDEEKYARTIAKLAFPGGDTKETMRFIKKFRASGSEARRKLWTEEGLRLLSPNARDPVSGYTSTPLGLTFALGLHQRGKGKGYGVQYEGIDDLFRQVSAMKFGAYADIPAFVREDEANLLRTLERVLPGNVDKLTNIVSGMEGKDFVRRARVEGVQSFGDVPPWMYDIVNAMGGELPESTPVGGSQPAMNVSPSGEVYEVPFGQLGGLMAGAMSQALESTSLQNIWPMSQSDLEEAITTMGRRQPEGEIGAGLRQYREWIEQRVSSDVPFSPREVKRISQMQTAIERMSRASEGWGVRSNVQERASSYLQALGVSRTDAGQIEWGGALKQHQQALDRSLAQEQQSQLGLMKQEVETRQELLDVMKPFIPKWKELNGVASESRKGIGALKDIDQSMYAKMTRELSGLGAEQWKQAGIKPEELAQAQGAILQGQLQEMQKAGNLASAVGGVFNKLTSGWELMRMSRMWNLTGSKAIGSIQTAAQQQAAAYQAASGLTPFSEMQAPTGTIGGMMRLQARTSRFQGLMGETAYSAYGGLMGATQTPQMAEAMGIALPAIGAGYIAGNITNIAAPIISKLAGVTLGPLAGAAVAAGVTGLGAAFGFGNRVNTLASNEDRLALSSFYGEETTAEKVALRQVAEQRLADRGITPASAAETAMLEMVDEASKSPEDPTTLGGMFRPIGAAARASGQANYEDLVDAEIKGMVSRGMVLASRPMSELTPAEGLEAVRAAALKYTEEGGALDLYTPEAVTEQYGKAMFAFPEMAAVPGEAMGAEWFKNLMLSGGVGPVIQAGKAWGILPSQSAQTLEMMNEYGWNPQTMTAAGERYQAYKPYAAMIPGFSKQAFIKGVLPREIQTPGEPFGRKTELPATLQVPEAVEEMRRAGLSPEPLYDIARSYGEDRAWGADFAEELKSHVEERGLEVGDDLFNSLTSKMRTWTQRLVPFGATASQVKGGVFSGGAPNISNQMWQSFTGSIGQWMPSIPAGGIDSGWIGNAASSIQQMARLRATPGGTFLDKEWGGPGIDTSWDYQRAMRDEQMRYTRAQTGFQVAKINAQRVYLWGADQGGTWDQPASGSLWSLQSELTEMQREYQYENQSNALERQKATAGLSYRQTLERLGLSREEFAVQQGYADIGFARQEEELARQFSRSRIQYGWKTEDLERKQMISGREFGWRMEDIEEELKYATGRQRRQLLVRQERETIRYGDQAQQFDTEEDRLQQLQDWRREDFAEREESLRIQMAKHRELSALQEEGFNMQERHARERYDLIMSFTEEDEERLEQLKEIHKKQDEITEKQHEYQAQQLNMQEQQAGAALAHAEALAAIRLEWEENQAAMTASSTVLDQFLEVLQFLDQVLTNGENNTVLQQLIDLLAGGGMSSDSLPYHLPEGW